MKRTVKDFSAPTAKGLGGAVRRAATALLLMLLTTATAWADADLIIRSTADWNTFAANVANGTNDYAGKTVILAADISISTMAGADNYNFFRGTFDGCGHTLTINLTGTYAGTAPFRRIENATIKNLNVEGTITTNSGMAGSIAFVTNGITHITNCLSTVTITGNNSGTDGGLVSCNNNELYFTNCAFKGKLLGSDEGFGGFVGWNNITVVYNHCLFAPSQVTMSTNGSSTFTRGSSSSTSNYNNSCYYTQSFGTVQGTYTNATGSDLQALLGDGWEIRDGNVVPKMVNSLEVTDVPYRAYNTVTKTFETLTAASCEIVTKATTTMGAAGTESWYVVSNNATVSSSRIEVLGTVNLILADGKSMRAEKGIHVPSGGTLNIYDQSGGTGELHAFSNTEYAAGIGGNDREANGTITIHGGSIETWGDYRSPGIGSGYGANGGTTIIYGGSITATGGYYAAGIGGGNGVDNNAGIITIAGGSVTAEGGEYGAGIGGGVQASGGTITITGGTVIAKAKYIDGEFVDNSQAIGNGAGATHDCTLYIGDMKVYSSANASNPVAPANRESICQSKYAKLIPCTTHNYVNGECTYCGGVPNVPVTYLAYHTATQSFVEQSVDDPLTVNQHITTMGADDTETWYAVRKNVTFSNRIEVRGTVHLILCDGKTLTASKGITVNNGNSLTIYGQTAGTGALNATGSQMGGGGTESAPIGSTNETTMGSITIHGGLITANSIGWTAGIGGGIRAGGGSITIYGGIINATGSYGNSEAIGHGADGANVLRDLADGLRVTTNNNSTPVAYGDRVSGLSQKIAKVEPCTEHYTTTDHCDYCGIACHRVFYDSNNATDGTAPTDDTVYMPGETVTVHANTGSLVRTGYTFGGWNTKANGSGTTYTAGATFTINGNTTLYAKWTPITYTIRFHKNHDDANGTMSDQTFTYDVARTLTANAFTAPEGYGFAGWCTTPDGDVVYADGQSVINLSTEQGAVINLYARWAEVNSYIAYNTETWKYENHIADNPTPVTSTTTSMSSGWYVVDNSVTVSTRIEVTGTVNLILNNGRTLTASKGLHVPSGVTLNIYSQSGDKGSLIATGASNNLAGIGGNSSEKGGNITIHGGIITASSTTFGAGIGAGAGQAGGTVNIYGGNVTAKCNGNNGAGIGGAGYGGNGGTVTITGGTVIAIAGAGAKAIGSSGNAGYDGAVTLGKMRVFASDTDTTPVATGSRVSTCQSGYAKLMPCTEHVFSNKVCTYCGAIQYTVTYVGNNATSGTAPTDATQYLSHETVTVLGNTGNLVLTGYTFGGWNTKADGSGTTYAEGSTFTIYSSVTLYAKWEAKQLELANNEDNCDAIDTASGDVMYYDVTLADQILYRNGDWNTLVLPFSLDDFTGTPLEGATVKTLASTVFTDAILTMNFSDDLNSIEAGKPYIVKWTEEAMVELNADLIIRSAADWNSFANKVNNGTSYEGKTVKLANDITVSTMVGNGSSSDYGAARKFCGTFDGCGHTLNVSISANQDGVAPFRFLSGATIQNLTISGSVTNGSSGKETAGMVAYICGQTTISNCIVSTSVTCNKSGDCSNGGFVARIQSGEVTINNCLFSGKLLGSTTHSSGGFVGWRNNTNIPLTFNNCLFAPSQITMKTTNSCTFNRAANSTSTYNNCYYKTKYGSVQGTQTSATGETLRAQLGDGWEVRDGNVVPKMISDIVNPVFTGVTISNTIANVSTTYASFIGSYAPILPSLGGEGGGLALLDAHNPNGDAMHASLSFTNPTEPPAGYSDFIGWYTDAEKTNPVTTTIPFATDGTVTLYTKWNPITYTVRFHKNHDDATGSMNDQTLTYDATQALTANAFTRDGYTFVGWSTTPDGAVAYTDGQSVINLANEQHAAIDLHAQWTPTTYTIAYDLAGGSVTTANPTSYNVESAAITLVNPTKDGYNFAGWIGTGLTEPTMTATIPAGSMGNKSYIALWAAEQLTLANNAGNGDNINAATGDGMYYDVTLADRTLYRDGDWNTLCLPFDVDDFTGTPLEGATVKTLTSSDFNDGTLTMNFSDNLTSIDAGKPYIVKWDVDLVIRSADDWNTFATNVNNGTESYEGKTVKLAADISVTTMVGTSSNPFKGTFDGCGHTLTFNYNATANDCAPFRYIDGATIRNLRVAGAITTSQKFAAGIAAYSYNNCVIESCQSSITITATINGDGTHSGFIAYPQNGTVNFRNCLFDGKLLGSKTTSNGGFVGYRKNACSSIAYTNCLFAPTELTMSTSNSCTFNRNDGNTFTNTYYTKVFGTAQGTSTTVTGSELQALLGDGWEVSNSNVVPKMVSDIVNPVFTGVTISNTTANVSTQYVDFVGTYSPVVYNDENRSVLFLGGGSTLYYPDGTDVTTIGACRAYFRLNGLTAGDPADPQQANVRAFMLNFGEDSETGIRNLTPDPSPNGERSNYWYSLDGRRLNGKPTASGVYINNGHKVVIK